MEGVEEESIKKRIGVGRGWRNNLDWVTHVRMRVYVYLE